VLYLFCIKRLLFRFLSKVSSQVSSLSQYLLLGDIDRYDSLFKRILSQKTRGCFTSASLWRLSTLELQPRFIVLLRQAVDELVGLKGFFYTNQLEPKSWILYLPLPNCHRSHQQPINGHSYRSDLCTSMNQQPSDMYNYSQHISSAPAPQSITSAGGLSHYSHHQQPPLLQPGPAQYPPPQSSYGQYSNYPNGLTSPQQGGHHVPGSMSTQGNVLSLPPMSSSNQAVMAGQTYAAPQGFDTTGQIAPPGMKPRVTATLWEDEGSLCFQVEAKGVCVARREGRTISLAQL
jgi:hypothetical protein